MHERNHQLGLMLLILYPMILLPSCVSLLSQQLLSITRTMNELQWLWLSFVSQSCLAISQISSSQGIIVILSWQ